MLTLIIDDDPEICELLESFLSENGHQVIKASTAQDGLKQFTIEQPDVIFLDIVLPDKNGLDLLKEIKTIDLTTFVAFAFFFPTRSAGPIKAYPEFEEQTKEISFKPHFLYVGVGLLVLGFAQKIIIADPLINITKDLTDPTQL